MIPDVTPELPPATWRVILAMLGRLPARALSRSFGRLADLPLPLSARQRVLSSFASAVAVDLSEAEKPLDQYPSLNAFFTRKLRPGVRTWPVSEQTVASPVDGIIGRFGTIEAGMAIQAKGHRYSVGDLLGDDSEAARYETGSFLTIYLSPRHYHRIHTPAKGRISRADYLPGALYPVNAPAVMHIPHLFARNERLVCHVDTLFGRMPVVAVGAYNVGRVSATFDPQWSGSAMRAWVTNQRPPAPLRRQYDPAIDVATGEEIMIFHLGSTVVLLFERGVRLRDDLGVGAEIRVGEPIGEGAAQEAPVRGSPTN